MKDFVDVHAVIAGVLLLFLHDADDFVRNAGQIDGLADAGGMGKRLLLRVGAQEGGRAGSASCPRQCKSVLATATLRTSANVGASR